LESEKAKKPQDIKIKKRIGDINKILQILPELNKEAEVNDSNDETPHRPKEVGNRI
jgi:hypothetical protein